MPGGQGPFHPHGPSRRIPSHRHPPGPAVPRAGQTRPEARGRCCLRGGRAAEPPAPSCKEEKKNNNEPCSPHPPPHPLRAADDACFPEGSGLAQRCSKRKSRSSPLTQLITTAFVRVESRPPSLTSPQTGKQMGETRSMKQYALAVLFFLKLHYY